MRISRIHPQAPFIPMVSRKQSHGFTLIEILMVLVIIGFVVSIAIPRLGRSLGTQVRTTARKIVVLNKELRHYARLRNKTYRLVIDFGDKEKDTGPSISVESASAGQLMADPSATPAYKSSLDKPPPDPFSRDGDVLKKPLPLPFGMNFEDVEKENLKKPITEGKAYIHFFPQGLVEKSVIHITDGKKAHWSLVINPLTGHTDVESEYVHLADTDK